MVEQRYSDEDRSVLLRFVQLAADDRFRLAAVETRTPVERRALLSWLRRRLPRSHLHELSFRSLLGSSVHLELKASLEAIAPRPKGFVLVLTDLEEMQGGLSEETPRLFAQLNVQRDLIARDLPVPILLCAAPPALLRLRVTAPDFCDYFSTLVRVREEFSPLALEPLRTEWSQPSARLELSSSDWPSLLRGADQAIARWEFDRAQDLLSQFRLSTNSDEWGLEAGLLEAELVRAREGEAQGFAALELLNRTTADPRRASTVAMILNLLASHAAGEGHAFEAERLWAEATDLYEKSGDAAGAIALLIPRAIAAKHMGKVAEARELAERALDRASEFGRARVELDALFLLVDLDNSSGDSGRAERTLRERVVPLADALEDPVSRAGAMSRIADALQARGALDEALRLRTKEELPLFERLGHVRYAALARGKIADIYEARGDLGGALRVWQEVLPVFERTGDVRSRALALDRIAEILLIRGDGDGALRVWRDEVLPIHEQLGSIRNRAVTHGRIADVLQARGQIDAALRIRREKELPVYDQIGDVRARAVTMTQIAEGLMAQGGTAEALAILRRDALPQLEQFADVRQLANALLLAAEGESTVGHLKEGLRLCRRALRIAESTGFAREHALARSFLARLLWRVGDRAGSTHELGLALSFAYSIGEPSFIVGILRDLATTRPDEFQRELERARAFFVARGRWNDLQRLDALHTAQPQVRPANRAERRRALATRRR